MSTSQGPSISRRKIFAGSVATAAVAAMPIGPTAEHPDAEVIRFCSNACAMTVQSDLVYDTVADISSKDPRYKPGCDEANRLGDIAYDLRERVLVSRLRSY